MAFTLVADIFAKVDAAITTMVSANVATIITDVTPLVATCLTIKLMMQGLYSMFNPGAGDSLSALIKEYLSIALILSFATAGGWYQLDLVNVALKMPDDFAGILTSPNKVVANGVPAIIDSGIEKGIRIVNTAWEAADVFSSSGLAAYAIGGIMMVATVVLGGLGAGFVIMAKILLAVTLCFGPIAIFCLLWGPTKNIFARWLGSVINYGMVVILLALVFGFIMQMFDNLLTSMNSDAAYSSITGSIAALLLTVISVFVLFQIPQVAASWGGGISANVAEAARSAGASMQTLGNIGSHGLFGGNAYRGGNGQQQQQQPSGGGGNSNGGNSGSNLSGKARGSRGKQAA
ncbi:type IV secretion system protein [Salmonella enterica subsp. enterica serovar Meleagridis]|nr:type IV secretion system protein [Salmonella enterica subsp. enterica serovar Cerro]EGD4263632.1 type IV secretion system protein [Salmonella enterica subsp. enterica serovar Cerro]EGD4267983.1 type IV secretion system protein [Salmonella enterica subsp. enterica serovar Cerro]EGD4276627.1 type IV secretion system protein [Salmonella enterica subsp. enterica serovar Meleagridis]EGD4286630.1 type IV secretion system protein [Salmonella enterica subsp. enterica serovar Meleagridis]